MLWSITSNISNYKGPYPLLGRSYGRPTRVGQLLKLAKWIEQGLANYWEQIIHHAELCKAEHPMVLSLKHRRTSFYVYYTIALLVAQTYL